MEFRVYLGENWGYYLAFFWGLAIALFIHMETWLSRWMCENLMWFVVATGVGVDLLILRMWYMSATGYVYWEDIVWVFALSSVPIAMRSIGALANRQDRLFSGITRKQD